MHHLDFLRAFMLLLVVPRHVGNIYGSSGQWIVKSPEQSGILNIVLSVGVFSMPGFFLISAMITIILLTNRDFNEWGKGRILRLGIPLLTCIFLLSPITIYFASSAAALGPEFTFPDQFSGDLRQDLSIIDRRWIGHLWFLVTMGIFTIISWTMLAKGVLRPSLKFASERLIHLNTRVPIWWILILAFATWRFGTRTFFYLLKTYLGFEPTFIALLNLDTIFAFFPFYFLGMMLGLSVPLREILLQVTKRRAVSMLTLFIIYAIFAPVENFTLRAVRMWLGFGLGLGIALLLIGYLDKYFTATNKYVSAISKQSYAIYLFHYPVVHCVGYYLLFVTINPILEFSLALTLTLAISFMLAIATNKIPILRFLFTGEPMSKKQILK